MKFKNKFFKQAKNVAKLSDFYRVRVGCVAVYKNEIIAMGHNSSKTHPLQEKYNKYRNFGTDNAVFHAQHAEINCLSHIMNLNIDFKKINLYIVRLLKNDDYALSRPCKACINLIKDLHIRNIYYTTEDGFAYEKMDLTE